VTGRPMEAETKSTTRGGAARATPAGDGAGPAAETFEVHNPADGSVVASLPVDGPERVREVVAGLRAAQPEWEALGVRGRHRWMAMLRDWLLDNADYLIEVMQAESGKVRADAALEPPYLEDAINFYGEYGERFLADDDLRPHLPLLRMSKRARVVYRPYPVVGFISPWNFPLILSIGDAIPALAAGAAVVIKPSEFTPLSLMEVVRAWKEEIGAPPVLEAVNGTAETGGAIVDECDFVHFTGSERTGKAVMRRAADTLTPLTLELGGKDPMVVLRDADLERATNAAAFGGLLNAGQICISIERVYVEEPIYDEFVEKLVGKVSSLRQGSDRDYTAEVGAMSTPAQTEIVADHVEEARRAGARILTGGRRKDGPGYWYEPTVIADVDHSMKVMREETFGPVIPVMKVADADEAVRLANDTTYGLSASVFTGAVEEGERIARRIEAGSCNVNDVIVNYSVLELPMGGWKHSGIGYRHGAYGIRKYCRTESLTIPRLPQAKSEILWFPYSSRRRRIVRALYRLFNARGLRNRLGIGRRG
jgi:acyl-CoA reductase-like NAD-dependent aldehyde dehydrogenase